MSSVIYKYEIPDPGRPIPMEKRRLGPSGELVAFAPQPIGEGALVGRTVDRLSTIVGTYGMGGPGFFGLLLGADWLILALWGAAAWIRADGRLLEDRSYNERGAPAVDQYKALSVATVGHPLKSLRVSRVSLEIRIADGPVFTIDEAPGTRPPLEGSGEARAFTPTDDLRRAVFLAPTDEIWV